MKDLWECMERHCPEEEDSKDLDNPCIITSNFPKWKLHELLIHRTEKDAMYWLMFSRVLELE